MDAREKWLKQAMQLASIFLFEGRRNDDATPMLKQAGDNLQAHLRTTPEGFALVPVEPTKAMLDAAEKLDWGNEDIRGNCCNMFMAMMAVADKPAPPKSEPL